MDSGADASKWKGKKRGQNGGARTAILICPTSWTRLVNMYDVRVSCYVWSMSRIIFIRRNEHDFLVLGLRNNGLEVVKGGLDLLTNFPLVPCPTVCCLSDYEIGYGNGTKLRARTARKKWGRERIPNELSEWNFSNFENRICILLFYHFVENKNNSFPYAIKL